MTKKLQHTIPDFQQQFVQSKMALTQGFDPNIEYKNTTEFWKNEKLPNTKESAEKEPAKNKHQLEYEENVRKPAGKTYLPSDFKEGELTEIIPGRAWVLPNVLTPEECSDWILRGQKAGMNEAKQKLRSSKRTSYYVDASMSAAVKPKLTQELISNVEKSDPGTEFKGVHTNWRIAEYQKGCTFPAHYDQDSFNILPPNEEGVRVSRLIFYLIIVYFFFIRNYYIPLLMYIICHLRKEKRLHTQFCCIFQKILKGVQQDSFLLVILRMQKMQSMFGFLKEECLFLSKSDYFTMEWKLQMVSSILHNQP